METLTNALPNACKEFEEDLVLYYYGEGAVSERSLVESHLGICSRCRCFLDDLGRLLRPMAEPKELSPGFWESYYREVTDKIDHLQEDGFFNWRKLFTPTKSWAVPAFGTAAVLVLGLTLTLGKIPRDRQSELKQGMIPQEILADANRVEFFKSMELVESLRALEALDGSNHKTNNVRSL